MKHNYPKTRKPRNTDYAWSNKLIKYIGTERLKEISINMGMYKASKALSEMVGEFVAPWTARDIRTKINKGDKAYAEK